MIRPDLIQIMFTDERVSRMLEPVHFTLNGIVDVEEGVSRLLSGLATLRHVDTSDSKCCRTRELVQERRCRLVIVFEGSSSSSKANAKKLGHFRLPMCVQLIAFMINGCTCNYDYKRDVRES